MPSTLHNRSIPSATHDPPCLSFSAPTRPHPYTRTPIARLGLIHDRFTKFLVGQSPQSLGIAPLYSCLAQMGVDFCARSIHTLFPCSFTQSPNIRHQNHPSDEPTASESPWISSNHSIAFRPLSLHLLVCPAQTASNGTPKPLLVVGKHSFTSMPQPPHETVDVELHDQKISTACREGNLVRGTTLFLLYFSIFRHRIVILMFLWNFSPFYASDYR